MKRNSFSRHDTTTKLTNSISQLAHTVHYQISVNLAPKTQLGTTADYSMTEAPIGTAGAGLPTLPVSVVLEVARVAEI